MTGRMHEPPAAERLRIEKVVPGGQGFVRRATGPALLIAGALQQFTAFTGTRSDSMLVIAAAGVVYGSIALLGATRMNLWSIRKHLASPPLQGAEVD